MGKWYASRLFENKGREIGGNGEKKKRGYENQALNFLSMGTTGGSAKLAVSLEGSEFMRALQAELDEMKTETPPALDDVISGNVPTWKIKIPTTLVVLQKGGELTSNGLPSFECGTPIATGNSTMTPLFVAPSSPANNPA